MANIFIRTFGCAHNQADSAMMAGQLEAVGHKIVSTPAKAELVLINSCTVKDPSQKRFIHEVQTYAQTKRVVIAGCVPQGDPENQDLTGFSAIGTKQLHKVVDVVNRTLSGEIVRELEKSPFNPPLLMPVRRKNPLVEIIPVNSGCLGKCTYCKTKHARGHLVSYTPDEIVEKAQRAIAAGVVELWLTSEDLGAYGRDINTTIVAVAQRILDIDGDFRVRLGMANPPLMHDIVDGLIGILNHPKCYKFLHIPIQTGSNGILEAMRREYTVEEFEELVERIVDNVPNITIATDIIAGFPGETDEDHQATMRLLKRWEFPVVNISKFYARPSTPAAAMKPVKTTVVKARSEEIHTWFASLNPNESLVGKTVPVRFTERGKNDTIIGRTPNYREVVMPKGVASLGTTVDLTISKAHRWYVEGTPTHT